MTLMEADLAPAIASNVNDYAAQRGLSEREAAAQLIARGLDAVQEEA